jgi:hypothetical protein
MDSTTALTLVLASLAVLLTALAIMVGIAAIWGYASIKEEAKKIATEVATTTATSVATRTADKTLAEYFEAQSLSDRIRVVMPPATVPPGSQELEEQTKQHEAQSAGEEDANNATDSNSEPK